MFMTKFPIKSVVMMSSCAYNKIFEERLILGNCFRNDYNTLVLITATRRAAPPLNADFCNWCLQLYILIHLELPQHNSEA
jgi:hypothetical protein